MVSLLKKLFSIGSLAGDFVASWAITSFFTVTAFKTDDWAFLLAKPANSFFSTSEACLSMVYLFNSDLLFELKLKYGGLASPNILLLAGSCFSVKFVLGFMPKFIWVWGVKDGANKLDGFCCFKLYYCFFLIIVFYSSFFFYWCTPKIFNLPFYYLFCETPKFGRGFNGFVCVRGAFTGNSDFDWPGFANIVLLLSEKGLVPLPNIRY